MRFGGASSIPDMTTAKPHPAKKCCPACAKQEAGRVLYGMPCLTPDLITKIDKGAVFLGGCIIVEPLADWHCNTCGYEWTKGRPTPKDG